MVLEHLGFPTDSHLERRHHCRDVFTVEKWWFVVGCSVPSGGTSISASTEHQYVPPQRLVSEFDPDGLDSPVHQPQETQAEPAEPSTGAQPGTPHSAPPVPPPEPFVSTHAIGVSTTHSVAGIAAPSKSITVSASEFHSLMTTVQMLSTTQASILQQMA